MNRMLLMMFVFIGSASFSHADDPTSNDDSGRSVFDAMTDQLLTNKNYDLKFVSEWKVIQNKKVSRQGKMAYRLRNIESKWIHEAKYALDDDPLGKTPDFESLYDGEIQIQLQTDAGLSLVCFPKPNKTRIYGHRVDGLAIFTGFSPFHTAQESDLFKIGSSVGWKRNAKKDEGGFQCIESDTSVGMIRIWTSAENRPAKFEMILAQDHFQYGETLQSQKINRLHTVYSNFRYEKPTRDNQLGLLGYRCEIDYEKTDGARLRIEHEVSIRLCRFINSDEEIGFLTNIPNGTRIAMMNNGNLFFSWQDDKMQKIINHDMESNLQGFEFHQSTWWSGRQIFRFGVVAVVGFLWLYWNRNSTRRKKARDNSP